MAKKNYKKTPKTNVGDIIEGFGFSGGPRGSSNSVKITKFEESRGIGSSSSLPSSHYRKIANIKNNKQDVINKQNPNKTSKYNIEDLPPGSRIISAKEIMAPKPPNYPPGSQHYSSKLKYIGRTKLPGERNKIISKLKVKKKKWN